MKPPPFAYHRPDTVDAAVALLRGLDNAKLLAGGQSLMPMLNLRYLYPDHVIDLNRVPGLDGIELGPDRLRIGAMVRQHRLETAPEVARAAPILIEALRLVGHRQTRNRGTIGGSLCHLDPAAELPTLALLYDAVLEIAGPDGARRVAMKDFMAGYMSPALRAGELVTHIELPLQPHFSGYGFVEYARRHGDFAVASAAVLLEIAGDGRIARAAIAIGGVEAVPVRLAAAEQLLVGAKPDPALFARAGACCTALDALSDVHAQPDYRRSVAGAMLRRALASAETRAGAGR
jgi:carbon-monoxide dehydrogenase medium subunit